MILHAGFHKTGTSSVQQMLNAARDSLAPALRILLKADMPALSRASRDHADAPSPDSLAQVARHARALFRRLDPADPRPVVLSCEDLSGLIPGRNHRRGYPEAAALMTAMAHGLVEAWAALPPLTLYFSTRAATPWIRSCHDHHLRVTRFTEDFAPYAQAQAPHADLAAIAAQIADALPEARLVTHALEDCAALPHGPLSPLLDLAGVPQALRDTIPLLPPANTGLPALSADLLALNRSALDREALKAAKKALIRKARRG
ncbi:hypothetical protein [Oceanicola sp. S124]|uniref:hypothetical protein n=1 Tax=Oceanicola sp. S124 TaxID=1042378 RepID=UPI0002559F5C|nr:hypothetical protein [Oceanicola sp. S124]